jgi:hypothetical protein
MLITGNPIYSTGVTTSTGYSSEEVDFKLYEKVYYTLQFVIPKDNKGYLGYTGNYISDDLRIGANSIDSLYDNDSVQGQYHSGLYRNSASTLDKPIQITQFKIVAKIMSLNSSFCTIEYDFNNEHFVQDVSFDKLKKIPAIKNLLDELEMTAEE